VLEAAFRKALREFDLDVSLHLSRETMVIVGPSGCGKTTTLRLLAGLTTADDGNMTLDGLRVYDRAGGVFEPPERRRVGMVFQNYALFPHLSVAGNVGYGLSGLSRDERKSRVGEALASVRMTQLAQARIQELSGGEQQRVALARAVVTRPALLLLDEPLSALDVETRAHVRSELGELLAQMTMPCIVVTHDFEDATVLGNRIAVMDRGRIVQEGTQQEVHNAPASAFVAAFAGANVLPARLLDEANDGFFAVEPWRLQLRDEPTGQGVEWDATVTAVEPRGPAIRVRLDGPAEAVADVPRAEGLEAGFEVGRRVVAAIDADDAHLLGSAGTGGGERSGAGASRGRGHSGPGGAGLNRWIGGMLVVIAALIIVAMTAVSGPGSQAASRRDAAGPVTAYVAANATDPFGALITAFGKAHPGSRIQPDYTGTQILYTQIQQGAPADLFFSADLKHVQEAKAAGYLKAYYPISITHVVIVVPKNNPAGIHGLQDLQRKGVTVIMGVAQVPIGIYTREVLTKADAQYGLDFSKKVLANVVSTETDVKQVVQKVALGEADAGFVYVTDVDPGIAKKVTVIPVPAADTVVATNYAGVLTSAPHPIQATELLNFIRSSAGRKVWASYGYTLPAQAGR
jgi:molybdenum ABC transporter molybdate-binding protein